MTNITTKSKRVNLNALSWPSNVFDETVRFKVTLTLKSGPELTLLQYKAKMKNIW